MTQKEKQQLVYEIEQHALNALNNYLLYWSDRANEVELSEFLCHAQFLSARISRRMEIILQREILKVPESKAQNNGKKND